MESDDSSDCMRGSHSAPPPLTHLLPRLREYLRLVDPSQVEKAEDLLRFSTEEELFKYLESTYGNTVTVEDEPVHDHQELQPSHPKPSKPSRSLSSGVSRRKRSRSKSNAEADEDALSDFIVSDSEEELSEEEEEEEFEESESDVEEPEPDDDLKRRKRLAKPPPQAKAAMPTRYPTGPTIVCKYGKACYRKNPVHFQEFAHPWLLNQPPPPA